MFTTHVETVEKAHDIATFFKIKIYLISHKDKSMTGELNLSLSEKLTKLMIPVNYRKLEIHILTFRPNIYIYRIALLIRYASSQGVLGKYHIT